MILLYLSKQHVINSFIIVLSCSFKHFSTVPLILSVFNNYHMCAFPHSYLPTFNCLLYCTLLSTVCTMYMYTHTLNRSHCLLCILTYGTVILKILVHVILWNVVRTIYLVLIVPRLSQKRGTLKLIRPSVCHKNFNLLISSEVLMIELWYLACMITVTSLFYGYHAVTLTFTIDLCQGKFFAGWGT